MNEGDKTNDERNAPTPRLTPLSPGQLSSEQAAFLAPYSDKQGNFANVFGMLAQHLNLAKAWEPFGLYTLRGNQLDPLEREILILRTAILINSPYEWHQHAKIARRLGMTDLQLEEIRTGTSAAEATQLLMTCAKELVTQQKLSAATWQSLVSKYAVDYVLDLIFTVGAYTALGMALNSCGIEVETDA